MFYPKQGDKATKAQGVNERLNKLRKIILMGWGQHRTRLKETENEDFFNFLNMTGKQEAGKVVHGKVVPKKKLLT